MDPITKDESTEFGTYTLVKKLQAKIIDVVRYIQVFVHLFELFRFVLKSLVSSSTCFFLGRVRLILV